MIKTLHIIGSNRLGGAERFYVRLTDALAESGWPTAALLRPTSRVAAELAPGVERHKAAMTTGWDPLSRASVARAIARLQPPLVQTYMGRATRLTHLPPERGIVHLARLGGYYNLKSYRHAHAWVGNTRGLCDYLLREGLPAARVFHIYNFIDLPGDGPTADIPGLPAEALLVLCAGRFDPVKGLTHLLSAFAALPPTVGNRPVHLALLGDGPLREELHTQAHKLGLNGRVHWPGWHTDPGPYYRRADLVAFPSLDEETLGNIILETWAYGKPLLTTTSRGGRELCRHGVDAWCVPCADIRSLSEGMSILLNDPALRAELAAAGQARVQRDFTRSAIVGQYQDLYQQLVK